MGSSELIKSFEYAARDVSMHLNLLISVGRDEPDYFKLFQNRNKFLRSRDNCSLIAPLMNANDESEVKFSRVTNLISRAESLA